MVSLSPLSSELLVGLGAAAAVVGVDADSHRLPALGHVPVVTLPEAAALEPDLIVVPTLQGEPERARTALPALGVDVLQVDAHDFDEAFELCRLLGSWVGRSDLADEFVRERAHAFARVSTASFGQRRPRIAAVVQLSPLEVAGGHSFTTNLIEIAGAESVTHGSEERRVPMTPAQLLDTAPDLVLVVRASEFAASERRAVREALAEAPRLAFLVYDADRFPVRDAPGAARRLRELVAPLSRELAAADARR